MTTLIFSLTPESTKNNADLETLNTFLGKINKGIASPETEPDNKALNYKFSTFYSELLADALSEKPSLSLVVSVDSSNLCTQLTFSIVPQCNKS